jgi:hypothetical protein
MPQTQSNTSNTLNRLWQTIVTIFSGDQQTNQAGSQDSSTRLNDILEGSNIQLNESEMKQESDELTSEEVSNRDEQLVCASTSSLNKEQRHQEIHGTLKEIFGGVLDDLIDEAERLLKPLTEDVTSVESLTATQQYQKELLEKTLSHIKQSKNETCRRIELRSHLGSGRFITKWQN